MSKNIEVYEEPVPATKKISHRTDKLKAGEENRIVFESLYWTRSKRHVTNSEQLNSERRRIRCVENVKVWRQSWGCFCVDTVLHVSLSTDFANAHTESSDMPKYEGFTT